MPGKTKNPLRDEASSQVPGELILIANETYTRDQWQLLSKEQVNVGGLVNVQAGYSFGFPPNYIQVQPTTVVRTFALQLRLRRQYLVNRLRFELARVPCKYEVLYLDSTQDPPRFRPLTGWHYRKWARGYYDRAGQRGNRRGVLDLLEPVRGEITGNSGTDTTGPRRWVGPYDWRLPDIRTTVFEFRLTNVPLPPVQEQLLGPYPQTRLTVSVPDRSGSMGLRNVRINYEVVEDPPPEPAPVPIGPERVVVRRYPSANAHDGGERTYWECAPQGAAKSIVPFYLDLRQADGGPALFDSLELVPLWTGPTMSAYWSNDEFAEAWVLGPNRMRFKPVGSPAPSHAPGRGLPALAAGTSWTLPNSHARIELNRSFVVGAEYAPSSASTAHRWLWALEGQGRHLGVRFVPSSAGASSMIGSFQVVLDGQVQYTSQARTLEVGSTYGVVVGYNRDDVDPSFPAGWHVAAARTPAGAGGTSVERGAGAGDWPAFVPATLRIGNSPSGDFPCLGHVARLWARLDRFHESYARYSLSNPDDFVLGRGNRAQRLNGYYCGVLAARLLESAIAQVGPGDGYYAGKLWTPVPIDYSLTASRYAFPSTVSAKFLKLEFTNLVRRTHYTSRALLPVTDFPQWVRDHYRLHPTPEELAPLGTVRVRTGTRKTVVTRPRYAVKVIRPDRDLIFQAKGGRGKWHDITISWLGKSKLVLVSGGVVKRTGVYTTYDLQRFVDDVIAGLPLASVPSQFRDQVWDRVHRTLYPQVPPPAPPNIYLEDQSTIDFLTNDREFDPLGTYRELQFAATLMKFFREARHLYTTTEVPATRHAYFVGIKELRVLRGDDTVAVDTPEYTEGFDDYLFIESGVVDAESNRPTLASFDPVEGYPGTPVRIEGERLDKVTIVRFGTKSTETASGRGFVVEFPALIRTAVPVGAATGKVKLGSHAGSVQSAGDFVVHTIGGEPGDGQVVLPP